MPTINEVLSAQKLANDMMMELSCQIGLLVGEIHDFRGVTWGYCKVDGRPWVCMVGENGIELVTSLGSIPIIVDECVGIAVPGYEFRPVLYVFTDTMREDSAIEEAYADWQETKP